MLEILIFCTVCFTLPSAISFQFALPRSRTSDTRRYCSKDSSTSYVIVQRILPVVTVIETTISRGLNCNEKIKTAFSRRFTEKNHPLAFYHIDITVSTHRTTRNESSRRSLRADMHQDTSLSRLQLHVPRVVGIRGAFCVSMKTPATGHNWTQIVLKATTSVIISTRPIPGGTVYSQKCRRIFCQECLKVKWFTGIFPNYAQVRLL